MVEGTSFFLLCDAEGACFAGVFAMFLVVCLRWEVGTYEC